MPTSEWVGHVDFRPLLASLSDPAYIPGSPNASDEEDKAFCRAARRFVAAAKLESYTFVREYGAETGHPHCHFWFRCPSVRNTIVAHLKKSFSLDAPPLPGRARAGTAQLFSLKPADPLKLDRYFLYLAKGERGRLEDPVVVLLEDTTRLWGELHDSFHEHAEELRASRKRPGSEPMYDLLVARCRDASATSKEDVLEVVCKFYVREATKGFESYAVQRTFWRVFSAVNGDDAESLLLAQCKEKLFKL